MNTTPAMIISDKILGLLPQAQHPGPMPTTLLTALPEKKGSQLGVGDPVCQRDLERSFIHFPAQRKEQLGMHHS